MSFAAGNNNNVLCQNRAGIGGIHKGTGIPLGYIIVRVAVEYGRGKNPAGFKLQEQLFKAGIEQREGAGFRKFGEYGIGIVFLIDTPGPGGNAQDAFVPGTSGEDGFSSLNLKRLRPFQN
jgi:hypothetical protein